MTIVNNNSTNFKEVGIFKMVGKVVYLGSLSTNIGGCDEQIKCRFTIAQNSTIKLTRIWNDKVIVQDNKLKLLNTLIFFIVVCGYGT